MKTRMWVTLAFLGAATIASAQDGWVQLFNGKDLTGWKVGGNVPSFTVQDGAIVSHGPTAHCFYDGDFMSHNFKNFELMVDILTEPGANGGVYFNTEFQEQGFPSKGFEVQVNETHSDPVKSGSLYHVSDVGEQDIKDIVKDNEWFTEDILVQGNTVTIRLNGKQVVKWTMPDSWAGDPTKANRRMSVGGTFALQGHDPKSIVHYKNIRVKPLP